MGIVGGLGIGAMLILQRRSRVQQPAPMPYAITESRLPSAPIQPAPTRESRIPIPTITPAQSSVTEPLEPLEPIIIPIPEPPAEPAPSSQPPMPVTDQESPVRPTPLIPFILERLELTKPWEFSRYRREAREIARKRREAYRQYYTGIVSQYRSGLDVRDIARSTADLDNVAI